MQTFFETERLWVRRLRLNDLPAFHEMQSNSRVMRYVRGRPMSLQENTEELPKLIGYYDLIENDFKIYAIERKNDKAFIGTVALVKDSNNDDEIGYRLAEAYWGEGYGFEVAKGLVAYCKTLGLKKLIACVANENVASSIIIEKLGFIFEEDFTSELNIPEKKFTLTL